MSIMYRFQIRYVNSKFVKGNFEPLQIGPNLSLYGKHSPPTKEENLSLSVKFPSSIVVCIFHLKSCRITKRKTSFCMSDNVKLIYKRHLTLITTLRHSIRTWTKKTTTTPPNKVLKSGTHTHKFYALIFHNEKRMWVLGIKCMLTFIALGIYGKCGHKSETKLLCLCLENKGRH